MALSVRGFGFSVCHILTLSFRQEFDYDGLMDFLELLEGFSDEVTAIHYVEQLSEQTFSTSLALPASYGNYKWHHDETRDNEHFKANHENSFIQCIFLRSFKILTNSGFESKYFQFEVIFVKLPEIIGPDLFNYFDAEDEWVDYFESKGNE